MSYLGPLKSRMNRGMNHRPIEIPWLRFRYARCRGGLRWRGNELQTNTVFVFSKAASILSRNMTLTLTPIGPDVRASHTDLLVEHALQGVDPFGAAPLGLPTFCRRWFGRLRGRKRELMRSCTQAPASTIIVG